jgi:hypothetical protein
MRSPLAVLELLQTIISFAAASVMQRTDACNGVLGPSVGGFDFSQVTNVGSWPNYDLRAELG